MNNTSKLKLWAILIWLGVWQLAAMAVGREVLLVSPWRVILRLGELAIRLDFWQAIAHSLGRIAGGFFLATVTGAGLALLAARYRRVAELLSPLMLTIRAVPVASFIILALVWISSRNLAVLIAFLMVLPVIYGNTLDGVRRLDPKLREMARVFRLPWLRRVCRVDLPQVLPSFLTGVRLSLGLCWKAGVAAEVIGMPRGSIGERLQQAKVYLDTPDLFAWTVVILIVSRAFEALTLYLFETAGQLATGQWGRR